MVSVIEETASGFDSNFSFENPQFNQWYSFFLSVLRHLARDASHEFPSEITRETICGIDCIPTSDYHEHDHITKYTLTLADYDTKAPLIKFYFKMDRRFNIKFRAEWSDINEAQAAVAVIRLAI